MDVALTEKDTVYIITRAHSPAHAIELAKKAYLDKPMEHGHIWEDPHKEASIISEKPIVHEGALNSYGESIAPEEEKVYPVE